MACDVHLLVGDCLRAESATDRTMPFCRAVADLRFERCYAPGTWTLPSYASLYTGTTPVEHGVTRRGDRLAPSQARLPSLARRNGYRTALVSENPTFSGRYGFDAGIDLADDFVNAKLRPSDFAPENVVDEVSPRAAAEVLAAIARSDRPARNLSNALYAPLSYGADRLAVERPAAAPWWPPSRFPHRGARVLEHCRRIAEGREWADGSEAPPLLSLVNLLEPHNPHSRPPAAGARAVGLELTETEQRHLASVDDNAIYYFEDPAAPPAPADRSFPDWASVFDARERVYEAQVREFDRLVARWAGRMDERFADALVVVAGDHGQLFGEEGDVGHHVSLHPHAVQVPLLVSLPRSWRDHTGDASLGGSGSAGAERVETPVSLVGLSHALAGVVAGEVDSAAGFAERVRTGGGDAPVVVAADGPNWRVAELSAAYGRDAVDDLAVRKVGLFERDRQVVLSSPWDDDRIDVTEYELADGSRTEVATREYEDWLARSDAAERLEAAFGERSVLGERRARCVRDAPGEGRGSGRETGAAPDRDRLDEFASWLAPERRAVETGPASTRLRQLGYR